MTSLVVGLRVAELHLRESVGKEISMAALHSATVRNWPVGLRVITILFLVISAFGPAQATPVYADKLVCGVPGKDGPASISGIVNTYYPGTANVSASSTTIPVGSPSGAAAPIQAGDLLLVIQMQGADINSTIPLIRRWRSICHGLGNSRHELQCGPV